jgi:aminomethyltransferase
MTLNADGGIVDDLIVWWWEPNHFWVMPNAANHPRVMAAFDDEPGTIVEDLRDTTALIAVQGPEATRILESILRSAPGRFRTGESDLAGSPVRMAGTGYTGEAGVEVCLEPPAALALVEALVGAGVAPVGLGARDTLRLEAGLTLWGEDIDETTSPLEAGLGFAVSFDHDFVGRDALMRQQEQGLNRALVGFVLEDRGVPRHGHLLRTSAGGGGVVTSGNMSPMLGKGIGLGYISPPPGEGHVLEVEIRDRWLPARLAKGPFHK